MRLTIDADGDGRDYAYCSVLHLAGHVSPAQYPNTPWWMLEHAGVDALITLSQGSSCCVPP
jgi:hypothetical protein